MINLLNIFETKYKDNKNFTLQLKTFDGNTALEQYLREFKPRFSIDYVGVNKSDDNNVVKIMPKQFKMNFDTGYSVIVGCSRVFDSNLRPNLHDRSSIARTIDVYNKDTVQSQSNFPSIAFNSNGKRGLDWIIEYNGNVCAWQNRVQDNLLNIYEDDYQTVYRKTLADPLTLSFIEKGAAYRENIINEVAPHSVTLMKSVSVRDYAGTLLFEEEKTRLYYTIRVLQDYMKENRVNKSALSRLPSDLQKALNLSVNELKRNYKKSGYSILHQELKKDHDATTFRDFLELVKLGHYRLSAEELDRAISYYNRLSGNNINSISDIAHETGLDVERRLTKRVMTMKKLSESSTKFAAKKIYIYRHGETTWNAAGLVKGQMDDYGVELTTKGLEQINEIARYFIENNIEEIYASDLERAKNTAVLANKQIGKPLSFHRELRGLNMGVYQGMKFSDFLKEKPVQRAFRYHNTPIPSGESINQLNKRLLAFLNKVVLESTCKNIAIIMHSAAMSNLKACISKEKYEDIEMCEILFENNKFRVIKTRQKS